MKTHKQLGNLATEQKKGSCFIHGRQYYRLSENHIIVMGTLELQR